MDISVKGLKKLMKRHAKEPGFNMLEDDVSRIANDINKLTWNMEQYFYNLRTINRYRLTDAEQAKLQLIELAMRDMRAELGFTPEEAEEVN